MGWLDIVVLLTTSASFTWTGDRTADLLPKDPVFREGADLNFKCLAPVNYDLQYADINFEIKYPTGISAKSDKTTDKWSNDRLYTEFVKKAVKSENVGNYTCTVSGNDNNVKTASSYVHVVEVNTRPVIEKTEAKQVRLDCLLSQQDELVVKWKKDDFTQENNRYALDGQSLVIRNVEEKDSEGHYECVVASKSAIEYYGSIVNATVNKATMTVPKQVIVVKVQQERPGYLICHVYGSPQATIQWMIKDGTSLNTTIGYNETKSLTFSDVTIPTNVTNLVYVEVTVEGTTKTFTDFYYKEKDVQRTEGSNNTVAIAIGVSLAVIVIILVNNAVIVYRCRRSRKQGEKDDEDDDGDKDRVMEATFISFVKRWKEIIMVDVQQLVQCLKPNDPNSKSNKSLKAE